MRKTGARQAPRTDRRAEHALPIKPSVRLTTLTSPEILPDEAATVGRRRE